LGYGRYGHCGWSSGGLDSAGRLGYKMVVRAVTLSSMLLQVQTRGCVI
jgi:hypothetical protein